MPTLTVTATNNYSGQVLSSIDSIVFAPPSAANATFSSSQFNGVQISNSWTVYGSSFVDTITVNMSATGVFSAEGWQLISFVDGTDFVVINGTGGADTITGTSGSDTLNGGGGADTIFGGSGDDNIRGSAGNDQLHGGSGFDELRYELDANAGGTGGVTVNMQTGTATDGFGNTDTFTGFEGVRGTNQVDLLTGSDKVAFYGEAFTGFDGADIIVGGKGLDEVRYDRDANAGGNAAVTVNLANGTAIDGFGKTDSLSGIENVRGTSLSDVLIGDGFQNTFRGLDGADNINGGAGHDTVSHEFDANYGGTAGVTVNLVTQTAIDGFGKTDILTSIEGVRGTNSSDTLTGNSEDNSFAGLGGADVIVGGDGQDEARYDVDFIRGGAAGINANLVNGTIVDGFGTVDTVTSIEVVRGTRFADTFLGSSADETFRGLAGNDMIDGGGGVDWVGYGVDIFQLLEGETLQGVVVNLALGTATDGFGNTDTLLNIENIAGSTLGDQLTGNAQNNIIRGNAGNDTIDGGAGQDTIDYSADHDTSISAFLDGSRGIFVSLTANTATDGFGDTDTLSSIENVIGTRYNDVVVGDIVGNGFQGGAGNDVLAGLGGNDVISGGAGTDVAAYSAARNNYAFAKSGNTLVVADLTGGSSEGIDTLTEIELLNFAGSTVSTENFTPTNFNGDLKSDLLWYNSAGQAVAFLMDGTTITSAGLLGPANGANWRVAGTGDLDGDGDTDLVWQDSSGLVVGWLMQDGALSSAAVVASAGSTFSVAGVGDLNADGRADIVLQNGGGQAVGWLMNGTSISSANVIGAANGAPWSVRALGDLNGDGRDDLIWQDTSGSTVGYLMNGTSISSASLIAGANGSTFSIRDSGDLNGDGRDDIVWQFSNGQAGAWLMNGTSIAGGAAIGGANGSVFEVRDVSDLNGDGLMDLVWENMSNGQAVGFLMNGTNITSAAAIGGANGSDWRIV